MASGPPQHELTLAPLGDCAVILKVATEEDFYPLELVRNMAEAIEGRSLAGITDVVPAFGNVTVYFEPARIDCHEALFEILKSIAAETESSAHSSPPRVLKIPVCYGGEQGPDLVEVGQRSRLSTDEVIALHSGGVYVVQAVGFAPGFGYLAGLPEKLHTPRRRTPRIQVPAGSVGIGGGQTGVYPLASPGGWNLIGRTPLKMFDPLREPPALLRTGDQIRFRAISLEEFAAWK